MGQFFFGLYAVLISGSVCGLLAVLWVGGLSRRVSVLERRLALGQLPPAVPSFAPPPVAGPGLATPPAQHPAPAAAVQFYGLPPRATAGLADPPAVAVQASTAGPAAPPRPRAPERDWWHHFELRAGTRWVTWLGAGALVIAAALFVKLAIDRGWLGPEARLALGVAGGVALLFGGRRAHRAEMRPLSQGLFGAGLGVLYVATYVAFASYGLIARELVFAGMIGVTITGCAIAIRHDAQPVAVLALVGGLITPVAVSSGGGARDALFVYLLVLDVGALAIAIARRWHALELIALAGTWVLFGGWLSREHAAAARPAELAWLATFHVTFVALPLGVHLFRRTAAGADRSFVTVANAVVTLVLAVAIVDGQRRELGEIVLAMAVMYAALEAAVRSRLAAGARGEHGFVALAAALATISVPLLVRGHAVTLAWSLEASALLALGFHDRRHWMRLSALGVLGLAMLNAVGVRWPVSSFAGAMIAPLGAWLFAGVHRALRERGDARDRWHGTTAALVGGGLALALVHSEVAQWFALAGRRDLGDAAVPIVWALGSLIALGAVARRESPPPAIAAAIMLAAVVAAGLCFIAYRSPAHPDALLALNLRFVAAAVTVIALAANAAVLGRRDPHLGRLLWAAAITGFGIAIGAEAFLHYAAFDPLSYASRRAHTALSIAWSGYAALLLAIGFVRRRRRFRLAGLALLGLVAIKLLLLDLAGAPQAYRVLSFLVAGALMIAVSYAYHRLERRQEPPEA
jgi:uncharacterized membrane protein